MNDQEVIFPPDTVVRIKETGQLAKIKKRCWCGGHNTPLHYEAWIEDKDWNIVITVLMDEEIEIELPCLYKE
jgi:hypothetical protein